MGALNKCWHLDSMGSLVVAGKFGIFFAGNPAASAAASVLEFIAEIYCRINFFRRDMAILGYE